jgi:DNA repair protein RadD
LGKRARAAALDRFERGETLVLANAFVLTEGWDSPRCSCVALLRPSSAKGTMIQMIGRGVRLVETGMYNNEIFKTDCVVLDFGNTTKKHGSLEQEVVLKPYRKGKGVAPMRKCPQCGFHCHATIEACPSCGHAFETTPTATIDDMRLSEIDPTEFSPFRWEYLNERCIAANGLTASVVVAESGGMWHAFGQSEKTGPNYQTLISSAKAVAIASADTFLQQHGDDLKFAKTRSWLSMPPTQEQLRRLPAVAHQDPKLNRYRASLYLSIELSKPRLEAALRERRRQIAA